MTDTEDRPRRVRFNFIKSNMFRVVHVDGAQGGVSPSGFIQMALYSERLPIPQVVSHDVSSQGELSAEILDERISRQDVVREVEVEAIMSLNTAMALRDWLDAHIAKLTERLAGKQ